jgi:alkaline phosphatase D
MFSTQNILGCLFIGSFLLFSCQHNNESKFEEYQQNSTKIYFNESLKPFYHGVASGDPSKNDVILWTRITPSHNLKHKIKWIIATDSLQKEVIKTGNFETDSSRDFTVKVVVSNLKPDTYYWYSFEYEKSKSIIGRTKTLPVKSDDPVKLIAVSCNAYEGGYFNAFKVIAEKKEKIDAILHLGDYIYESFLPRFINKKDRIPLPKKELITLSDYRTRYSQYRLDPDLMRAHQMHPFINIWDDHEIANDSYKEGAGGHNPDEDGSYEDRKSNAKKAFYEWLPITENEKHYRSFDFGEKANLFMIDGRLEGRTVQKKPSDSLYNSEERTMLGQTQFDWLMDGMSSSNSIWKIIGNPVLFSKYNFSPVISDVSERENDSWLGYPFARNKFISAINSKKIENLIFLSGDSHSSWVFEVQNHSEIKSSPIAVEFGVPSISSENWDTSNPADRVIKWEKQIMKFSENLKYVNLREHGYTLLTLTNEMATCTWYFIDKDKKTLYEEKGPTYSIKQGDYELKLQQ